MGFTKDGDMEAFNAYLIGVGGQGIGMLSEILIRAADHAGHRVKAVDTHGLAQRGGRIRRNASGFCLWQLQ